MAGKISKVLKVLAALAALACVYMAGRKDVEAERVPVAGDELSDAVRPGMSKNGLAVAQTERDPRAYHEAIGQTARGLKARIAQTAYSNSPLDAAAPVVLTADAELAVPDDASAEGAGEGASAAAATSVSTEATAPEKPEGTGDSQEVAAPEDARAEHVTDDAEHGASEREEAAKQFGDTGELEPYERIQKALVTSELFDEEGERAYKPAEFSMPKHAK